jgi:RNA polymerase sigma factor (sigma-70 family)
MSESGNSTVIEGLIERLQAGDLSARRELLEHAHDRLSRLANRILHGSFPALGARHDVQSVVNETWLRLMQTLETAQPPTVDDFFRLAAHKVRQVLLDLAEREQKRVFREALSADGFSADGGFTEPSQATYNPGQLAEWTEFHKRVESLPADERSVFEMHYYLELTQAEIAKALNLHPRKVSYLWVAATETLAEAFGGLLAPEPKPS